ncbi:MAG: trypsin-like peptidase domain-containing protein [Bacteroidales bacterium]|nr:trypsin-like peptidase domain-containing protein [Bacteroidales bacterium]
MGFPEGLTLNYSDGIISGFRSIDFGEGDFFIQITTDITHGSSGGPLFNMNGEVVGVTSRGANFEGGNFNFAINIQKIPYSKFIKK